MRRPLAIAVAACAAFATTAVPAASAATTPKPKPSANSDANRTPTPLAKSKGVTRVGDARMNWQGAGNQATVSSSGVQATTQSGATRTTTSSSKSGVVTQTTKTASSTVVRKIGIQGIDVSSHTLVNDWRTWNNTGIKFVYAKVTEGTSYKNPKFAAQFNGAKQNGMYRGAYHFASPSAKPGAGAAQADFAIANGGGRVYDNKTLPLALDMEWNPYGPSACYGMTNAQMNTFTRDFVNRYRAKTGRNPMIYTASSWWNQCVGTYNYKDVPLWLARYNTTPGAVPTSWQGSVHTIWQNAPIDSKGFDTDIFNGDINGLFRMARGY